MHLGRFASFHILGVLLLSSMILIDTAAAGICFCESLAIDQNLTDLASTYNTQHSIIFSGTNNDQDSQHSSEGCQNPSCFCCTPKLPSIVYGKIAQQENGLIVSELFSSILIDLCWPPPTPPPKQC
ncbi:MAG: hypothetical protein AB1489_16640 [Acidobacteriota bacterium]